MSIYISLFSQLCHLLSHSFRKPETWLEKGMLIISIDIDVGSKELGRINRGKNDRNVNRSLSEYRIGEIEEMATPLFIEMFDDFEIPVTFAIRGQSTETDSPILEALIKSSAKHDIGAHGYYHRKFTSLSSDEAEKELRMISAGARKFGIIPKSFVFPGNSVAYLHLLKEHAYKCYRGKGGLVKDRMEIKEEEELYNVYPSLYISDGTSFAFLRRMLDLSIEKKLPFHMWFHLWNFGETRESVQKTIRKLFLPIFKYAKRQERRDVLSFETMLSAALKADIAKWG